MSSEDDPLFSKKAAQEFELLRKNIMCWEQESEAEGEQLTGSNRSGDDDCRAMTCLKPSRDEFHPPTVLEDPLRRPIYGCFQLPFALTLSV